MKKIVFSVMAVAAMLGLVFAVAQADNEGYRKIVVFKVGVNEAAKDEISVRAGGVELKDLGLINAKAVWLPSRAAAEKLASYSAVLRIDEDVQVFALAKGSGTTQPAQVFPWGIDRVDAEKVWPLGNTADSVKVGIIDTGIAKDHPDLKGNIVGGVNTINPRKGWNDDNGHGSHVAGIVGALNNSIGVVGAGPAADLYAIKVLGASGSGYLSDVIKGIQWAAANGMQVVNMSLGTASDVQSFHDAVIAAKKAGIVVVAAAGNSASSVLYPAAYPETIAVSATDQNNIIAGFSSRGTEVDLTAPGVSIYSTYKGTGYATLSGTSMAAPHVTGVVALVLYAGGGNLTPDEVQAKLQNSASDLGTAGLDELYGWGLVNALNAVAP